MCFAHACRDIFIKLIGHGGERKRERDTQLLSTPPHLLQAACALHSAGAKPFFFALHSGIIWEMPVQLDGWVPHANKGMQLTQCHLS